MKMLKKWIAFCLVILLLAGVAFDKGAPVFNQVEAAETEGSEQAGSAEASTEEPTDSQQTEGEASGAKILDEQPAEQPAAQQPDNTAEVTETAETTETTDPAPAPEQQTEEETVNTVETDAGQPAAETPDESVPETEKTEQKNESQETPAAEPEAKKQDAMELKQEIRDEEGNLLLTVTAGIKEDTFSADTSEVTMKVSPVDSKTEKAIKKLASEELEKNQVLGNYFLYNVEFQVNGITTEPGKEIKITFEPDDFLIKDTEKATVFYYNESGSPEGNEKAEIVEIIQKSELVDRLQAAGESTDGIDDDYDLTEIVLNKDGKADKIITEGRRSTIYGCYLEEDQENPEAQEEDQKAEEVLKSLEYENDDVIITVSESEAGAIPEGAELKVVPILEDDKDTEEQYKEVEDQIQKKAEEDEKQIAGFLAYDISFVDDEGNEIEPDSEVKVTMEYKQPALPLQDTDLETKDTEVSVLHLEEDTDGNVTQVVNMVEAGQLDAIETGNSNQVQKVEMRTESFSVYVIQWGVNSYYRVKLVYTDESYKEFDNDQTITVTVEPTKEVVLSDYAIPIQGKTFIGARVVRRDGFNTYHEQILKVRVNDTYHRLDYWFPGNNDWGYFSRGTIEKICLVYKDCDKLTTVETVDNSVGNITMRMKNFDDKAAGQEGSLGGTYDYRTGKVHQNLVKSKLSSTGYPVTTRNGKILNAPFEGGQDVNHLFIKEIYDEEGYYEYSSFDNYAYLGNGTNFTVYNQLGTFGDNVNSFIQNRGNFLPYNSIASENLSECTNKYDPDGNKLNPSDPESRYGEQLYLRDGTTDYNFSMYLEVTFLQPRNGYVDRNGKSNPMIYEFNGDDDLWVFIDDNLVLDIGGSHDAHSGTINFSTGEVSVVIQKGRVDNTTIRAMYKEAGRFPDGTVWEEARADEYFDGNTFRDYTTHTLKMFYMERGGGASDLYMRFNLDTVPKGTVEVTKELSNTDKEKYANVDFAFQVYAQKIVETDDFGNETYPDSENPEDYVLLNEATDKATGNDVDFNNVTIGGTPYDSVFYLKPGETAQFSGLQDNRKYYVKEIGVSPEYYDKISVNGTVIKDFDSEGAATSEIQDVISGSEAVYKRPAIVFVNNCSEKNHLELRIKKQMLNQGPPDDTFSFKIQLSDQNGRLINYTGDYYLMKGNNYYYYESGSLINGGTDARVCGSTSDGIIQDIGAEFEVILVSILAGTEYKVWEVDPNTGLTGEKYNDPWYLSDDKDAATDADHTYTSGQFVLNENVNITVQNAVLNESDVPELKVQKSFVNLNQTEVDQLMSTFQIMVKDQSGNEIAVLGLSSDKCESKDQNVTIDGPAGPEGNPITYTWTLKNIDEGIYKLEEKGTAVTGRELESTEVNEAAYAQGDAITIQKDSYAVTESGKIQDKTTTELSFTDANVLVIKMTDAETAKYFIWTEDKLSAGERKGLLSSIVNDDDFTNSDIAESDNIVFTSGPDSIQAGLYYGGSVKAETDKLIFTGGTKDRDLIWLGKYQKTTTINAEIEVVNTYNAIEIDVDVKKYKSDFTTELTGAQFSLYKGTLEPSSGEIKWESEALKTDFEVKNADAEIELEGLAEGYYKLVETVTPQGYLVLTEDIFFKVDTKDRTIIRVDDKGQKIDSPDPESMWNIKDNCINVKNVTEYKMPSSGGPGIYWYLFGGMLLMMTASLMVYKNKRREVLERR